MKEFPMQPLALAGALVAGVVGALVWGGISVATNFEIGYIAWGIGLAVGGAARWSGGHGKTTAVMCAAVALVSIFAGKVLAVQWSAPGEIREALDSTREYYDEMMSDADALVTLPSADDHPKFMIDHEYTEAEKPEDVSADELEYFRTETVPMLMELHEKKPTFEEWRDDQVDRIMADFDVVEAVVSNLGLFDAVFALLGIATAYKLVMGADEEEAAPAE